ncbi:MAG: sigma-70 family RNA polymerase sigma factor [Phycisphaerae bacterium]|nr:sigma-70 family RNA polymerase sigma factor [Phycisphaerae bacterium]
MPTTAILRRLSESDRELLQKRLSEPTECQYHPSFRRSRMPGSESESAWETKRPPRSVIAHGDNTLSLSRANSRQVLSAEAERTLFLRFNYCRHRVMRILRKYRGRRLDAAGTRELLRWEHLAQDTRAEIVRANTSLVLAMARRARHTRVELGELVCEGNLALVRCVDKFDASRGFKFSTYACRAILAGFSRTAAKATRLRAHFPTTYDPAMERSDYLDRKRERIELECVDELKEILFENSAELSAVERRVLDARFLLGRESASATGTRRRTLDQVGTLLGVSKERVRQIQNQAMGKLRAVLEQRLPVAS